MDFAAHPKPLLFTFMGEGEPFLNFDACVAVFHELAAMDWPVPMRLAVSTSGIRPDLIRRLSEITFRAPLRLQVSLHGPSDEVRSRIIPVAKPLAEILGAARAYRKQCGRPLEWNYVMCAGVNDLPEHAQLLAALLGPGWRVRFGRLNMTPGSLFRAAPRERAEQFRRILETHGIATKYFETDESEINSGCGQLSYHFAPFFFFCYFSYAINAH
jgi:23S rRNA (adenine2503-C2)-methyltransferase